MQMIIVLWHNHGSLRCIVSSHNNTFRNTFVDVSHLTAQHPFNCRWPLKIRCMIEKIVDLYYIYYLFGVLYLLLVWCRNFMMIMSMCINMISSSLILLSTCTITLKLVRSIIWGSGMLIILVSYIYYCFYIKQYFGVA